MTWQLSRVENSYPRLASTFYEMLKNEMRDLVSTFITFSTFLWNPNFWMMGENFHKKREKKMNIPSKSSNIYLRIKLLALKKFLLTLLNS